MGEQGHDKATVSAPGLRGEHKGATPLKCFERLVTRVTDEPLLLSLDPIIEPKR